MRRLSLICIAALAFMAFAGCDNKENKPKLVEETKVDSLKQLNMQKDSEINEMLETFNQIQEGLREIGEAENRVSVARAAEGADRKQQIMEDISFINNTMKQNRALIARLKQQMRESSVKGEQLQRSLEQLIAQLDEKEEQIKKLRAELEAKDIHIAQLDETISTLNSDVSELQDQNSQKAKTINDQTAQLNTAWFAFGTKQELKTQRIIDGSRVLESNFNKSYFTKIDIRVQKEIKLYSKYAKVMTTHPSSSYTLEKDANKQYVLKIDNPQLFWSTSKYLVVLVK